MPKAHSSNNAVLLYLTDFMKPPLPESINFKTYVPSEMFTAI